MASTSPSPNSPSSITPPNSTVPPPVQPSSPPPAPLISPPSQTNASSPTGMSATPPPPQLPPPPLQTSQPPMSSSPPSPAPPPSTNPPPPPSSIPPERSPPPPSDPPATSSPPQSSNPPAVSPPPQPSSPPPPPTANPPAPSPPPPKSPPSSPQPPPSNPPKSPPSAPPPESPVISPPPPSNPPKSPPSAPPPARPVNSPPPPITPPRKSPSPPANPPMSSPPPPSIITPPASRPTSNSPPPPVRLSPPPPLHVDPPSSTPPPPPPQVTPGNPSTNNSSANAGNGGIGTGGTVAIGLVVGLLALSVIGTVVWCIRKRKKKVSGINGGYILPASMGSSPRSESGLLKVQMSGPHTISNRSGSGVVHSPSEPGGLGNSRSWFTYEELFNATNGFSEQNLLGEGGFGSVYKGLLPDGKEVAVKQLKIGGGQGEREFKAEVEIISRIHHRHLVSLVGYCISESQRLLVYDYVPNNSLHFHLHGHDRPVMDWATRVRIAAGAARGIAYLHEDCHPRIIHRDIKSSNILLDNNFEARVADFGLARLALDADTHVTTRVMGTFGYVAPEYASSGKLTEKSDVFSFGVVLLELITGRKPVDASQPLGDESLVEWARPLLSHALDTEEFEGLVDPRLEKNYVDSEMFQMIEAAAACVRHSSLKRPRMGQVVRVFDSMATVDLSNGMKVGESQLFNSAQQSAEIRLFRRMAFGSQDYSTDFFSQSSFNDNSQGRRTQ